MQSEIFEDLCKSSWEHYAENFPTHSRDIAKLFNPIKIVDLPAAGMFTVLFTDGSAAMCGLRGSSILGTFNIEDHDADPLSHSEAEGLSDTLVIDMSDFGWHDLAQLANVISNLIDEYPEGVHIRLAGYFRTMCNYIERELPEGKELSDVVRAPHFVESPNG
jgi:hypothetical protein